MTRQDRAETEGVIWARFRKRAKDLQDSSLSIQSVSSAEKKRIFQARAQALSQEKGRTLGDEHGLHLISFYVAGEFFGIEVKYLQEIYESTQITKIPCTPDVLVGLMNYRGAVLTIIDLSLLLDLRREGPKHKKVLSDQSDLPSPVSVSEKVLIVEYAGAKAGLIIQALDTLLELPKDTLQAVSPFFQDRNPIVKWEAKHGNMPLLIIDPEEMLNDERLLVNEDVS